MFIARPFLQIDSSLCDVVPPSMLIECMREVSVLDSWPPGLLEAVAGFFRQPDMFAFSSAPHSDPAHPYDVPDRYQTVLGLYLGPAPAPAAFVVTDEEEDTKGEKCGVLRNLNTFNAAIVRIGRDIIVSGGLRFQSDGNTRVPHSEVSRFSGGTHKWSSRASLTVPRYEHSMVGFANRVLVMGGRHGVSGERMKRCEALDTGRNEWLTIAPLNHDRANSTTILSQSAVFLWGGRTTGTDRSGERYDIATNSWAPTADMPRAGMTACCTLDSETLLGFFSKLGPFEFTDIHVYLYSTTANVWTKLPWEMCRSQACTSASTTALPGYLVCVATESIDGYGTPHWVIYRLPLSMLRCDDPSKVDDAWVCLGSFSHPVIF